MTRPPSCAPPPDSNGLVVLALVIFVLPFLGGATGSIVFAREALGPLVTLVAWIVFLIATTARYRRMSWVECLPLIGGLVVLQLLLDLRTPHLGDLIIGALHAIFVIAALARFIRDRRARSGGGADRE